MRSGLIGANYTSCKPFGESYHGEPLIIISGHIILSAATFW